MIAYNPENVTAMAGDTTTFELFVLIHLLHHLIVLDTM